MSESLSEEVVRVGKEALREFLIARLKRYARTPAEAVEWAANSLEQDWETLRKVGVVEAVLNLEALDLCDHCEHEVHLRCDDQEEDGTGPKCVCWRFAHEWIKEIPS